MLQPFYSSYDHPLIYKSMPTEREHNKYNPELKSTDKPSIRLRFLNQIETSMYSANPYSITIRVVVLLLALYGFIKLTNHIF